MVINEFIVCNEHLKARGWTVLRFWGEEIKKDVLGCVAIIKEAIEKAKST
ncbi:DUF559 domain-containing protein [Flavobacterium cyanobacteriorum]